MYEVPADNPFTVIGEDVPDTEIFPGVEVTVYPEIVAPPSDDGAVKATATLVCPVTVTLLIDGAPGTLGAFATENAKVEFCEAPFPSVAVTVYVVLAEVEVAVPLISPVDVFSESPAGKLGRTEYVTGEVPPLKLTGVNALTATSLYTPEGTVPVVELNAVLTPKEKVAVEVDDPSVTETV